MTENTDAGQFDDCSHGNATANAGYDDNCNLHPACGFDYDTVFVNCGDEERELQAMLADMRADDMERAFKLLQAVMRWVHQNGSNNLNGVAIRALIVCWHTLPYLRPLSLTELARGYGLKKQSVGRWVEEPPNGFKVKFPTVKTGHMSYA
jgi:hypothetical protein